jgi:hypothetical protein
MLSFGIRIYIVSKVSKQRIFLLKHLQPNLLLMCLRFKLGYVRLKLFHIFG